MKPRICVVTAGHLSTCPRMLKAADALAEAGYRVRVVSTQQTDWAAEADLDVRRRRAKLVALDRGGLRPAHREGDVSPERRAFPVRAAAGPSSRRRPLPDPSCRAGLQPRAPGAGARRPGRARRPLLRRHQRDPGRGGRDRPPVGSPVRASTSRTFTAPSSCRAAPRGCPFDWRSESSERCCRARLSHDGERGHRVGLRRLGTVCIPSPSTTPSRFPRERRTRRPALATGSGSTGSARRSGRVGDSRT